MAKSNDPVQPVDWSRASADGDTPQTDSLAEKERAYLDMTPTERGHYDHIKLVERLEDHIEIVREERDRLSSEAIRLREVETKYEVLKNFLANWKWPVAIAAVLTAIGGAVISSHSGIDGSKLWQGVGWGLLVLPAVFTCYVSIFGKQSN